MSGFAGFRSPSAHVPWVEPSGARNAEEIHPVTEPSPPGASIEVVPVVVISQTFPARPSFIPEIRDFVRRCLADSPLNEDGVREVGETVFRALLDAAGPTGFIQVAFRIFPEHVEVDVLHSETQPHGLPAGAKASRPPAATAAKQPSQDGQPAPAGPEKHAASFAEWMSSALRREGMTQEAAAQALGVSVKTVSRWVGGATQPRMRDLKRIRDVFGEVPLH
jgi:DNA-binding XRE family transcriptional regulator